MSSSPRIRLLVVDDHPVIRQGLGIILGTQPDLHVIGEAADAEEAEALFSSHLPDVTLMDIAMPGMDGITLTAKLRAQWPGARIVMFTHCTRTEEIRQSLKAGARAYVQKGANCAELLAAIRAVHCGGRYLPADISHRLDAEAPGAELSPRERRVLELVFKGQSSKQIGVLLNITENTVNVHVRNILRKLGASSRTDAINLALHKGILRVD